MILVETGFGSRQFAPEVYQLGSTEMRRIGAELWFMNQSQIAWTQVGRFLSSPENAIRALRDSGFEIPGNGIESIAKLLDASTLL